MSTETAGRPILALRVLHKALPPAPVPEGEGWPVVPVDQAGLQPDGSVVLDRDLSRPYYSPVCSRCQWLGSELARNCLAYVGGIPDAIWRGVVPHTTPYPGDHGYLFTPVPGTEVPAGIFGKSLAATAHPHAPHGGQGNYRGGQFVPTGGAVGIGSPERRQELERQHVAQSRRRRQPAQPAQVTAQHLEELMVGQAVEHGAWIAPDGQLRGTKVGTQSEIEFTPSEMAQMAGCLFTHNHPVTGGSFSVADVRTAMCYGLSEMRAVGYHPETGRRQRFILRPGAAPWDQAGWEQVGVPAFMRANTAVSRDLQRQILQGRLTPYEASANHFDLVWTRWAQAVGAEYVREEFTLPGELGKSLSPETTFRLLQRYEADPAARTENELLLPALLKSCGVHGVAAPDWLVKSQMALDFDQAHPRAPKGGPTGGQFVERPAAIDAPEGWAPAPAHVAFQRGDEVTHTLGRHFVRGGRFYKPQSGYGPIFAETDEAGQRVDRRHRHPTDELAVIEALSDLPAVPRDVQAVTVNGEPYLSMPELEPLDLKDPHHAALLFQNPRALEEIEATVRAMDRRGVNYHDNLQFAYDPEREKVVLNDFSNARIGRPDHFNETTNSWEGLLMEHRPDLWAKRRAASRALWDAHKFKQADFYVYGGFHRPPGGFEGSTFERDGAQPGSYEVVPAETDLEAKPHFYVFSQAPLPAASVASYELERLRVPDPQKDSYVGLYPGDPTVAAPLAKSLPKGKRHMAPKTQDWEHPLTGLDAHGHTAHMRHHEAEYRALQHQMVQLEPDDQDGKRKIVQAMRKLARHWHGHRQAKYAGELGREKLPKLVLKSFSSLLKAARAKKPPAPAQSGLFDTEAHPHAPVGGTGKYHGGQFVPKDAGTGTGKPAATPAKPAAKPAAKKKAAPAPTLAVDVAPTLKARELKLTDEYLAAGIAEIKPEGEAFKLRLRPPGSARYKTVGTFPSEAHARAQILPALGTDAGAAKVRAYHDVGARIGGARKEIALARSSFLEKPDVKRLQALEHEDPDAAMRCVQKGQVWPKPDPDALNVPLGLKAMTALVYAAVGSKPSGLTAESRQNYLQGVQMLQKLVGTSQNGRELGDKLEGVAKELKAAVAYQRYTERKRLNPNYAPSGGPPAKPTKFQAALVQQSVELGADFVGWLTAYKPLRGRSFGNDRGVCKELDSGEAKGMYLDAYKKRCETVVDSILGKRNTAPAAAAAEGGEGAAPKAPKKKRWERSIPSSYMRQGGKPIDIRRPEDYLKRFGLRGVEFGNWMDNDSSKVHVDRCAEAFQDLADIIDVKSQDVSLNGRLALAFGARGTGWAAAHYEPGKRVINLTKDGGAGSLGHEWAHFLDDILAEQYPGTKEEGGPSSHISGRNYTGLLKSADPVRQAVGQVMRCIHEGNGTRELAVKPTKFRSWGYVDRVIAQHPGDPQAVLNELWEKKAFTLKAETRYRDALHYVGSKMGATVLGLPTGKSEYFERNKLMGDYWAKPEELFARAFETYLVDTGKALGRHNNYLVSLDGGNGVESPYATGKEREALTAYMGLLVNQLNRHEVFKKALAAWERTEEAATAPFPPTDHLLKSAGGHRYGCVMLDLSEAAADILRSWTTAHVPDGDLAKDGRDKTPHITLLYGLESPDAAPIQAKCREFGKLAVAVGDVSVFSTPKYDVVKLDVGSRSLRKLNRRLQELPHVATHPEYKPHITLAYVQPGLGAKYAGLKVPLSGEALVFAQAVYSAASGEKSGIDLVPAALRAAVRYVTQRPKLGLRKAYNPNEPRDARGRWSEQGGDGEPPATRAELTARMKAKYGPAWPTHLNNAETDLFWHFHNEVAAAQEQDGKAHFAPFEFGQVLLGDWEKGAEGQKRLAEVAQAFTHLGEALGLTPKQVTLGGRLNLAFSGAATADYRAAYHQQLQRIEVGHMANGGCIAHEWGHFLDDMLSTLYGQPRPGSATHYTPTGKFPAHRGTPQPNPDGLMPERVQAAVADLVAMFHRDPSYNTPLVKLGQDADRARAERDENARTWDADGNRIPEPYYQTNPEMFARAFEVYVRLKLEQSHPESPLVRGANGEDGPPVYPARRSRTMEHFTRGFDRLFDLLRQDEFFQKALRFLEELEKAHRLQGRLDFQGLKISIENRKGSLRRGTDADGKAWETKLFHPYGYIRGTLGPDGDHVDCYVGPNPESTSVYIVHQQDPETGLWDEDKCMVGFDSAVHARDAYLAHYNSHKFLGPMTTMSIEAFKERVQATRQQPGKLEGTPVC